MTRTLLRAALFGATALAIAAPASAQQIDRIVAFGDSYADDGNFFELAGINPITGTSGVYTTGRFSGGTNYIDTLSQILQVPVDNFAIGGARSDNTNQNNPINWGFTYEVDQFLNVGTQSSAFPATTAPFNETDLVAVSIGGNDARNYQLTGGTLGGAPAAAAVAAASATGNLNRLVAAGAPTISFLAGDTGRLPEIAGNTAAQAIRSSYSTTFNAALQTTLAGYAANGVMVHYLDLNRVLDNIVANPGAYGITNGIACPALPSPTCVISSSGYLFYADQLHLTSAGFAIVGRYVAAQLAAPLTLQAPSDVGMDVGRQFGRIMTTRMDLGSPRDGDTAEGWTVYFTGDGYTRSLDSSRGNNPFDVTSVGVTAGAEYGFGTGIVGFAGNVSRPKANFGDDSAKVVSTSGQIGIYAGAGLAGGFVQGYLGYGWDDYKISRNGVVEGMNARTDGNHTLAGVKAGYLFPVAGLRVGPVAALDYARAKVEGYTEDGDPALTLNVSSTSFNSLRGSIGLEARGDMGDDGATFRPYGALVLEQDLSGDDRGIAFAQTASPGIVNGFAFESVSKKAYGRFTGGLSASLFGRASLDAGISMTFGKKQGNETSGQLGLRLGF